MDANSLVFDTYDIGLTAGLLSSDHKITDMDTTDPKRVKFYFGVSSQEDMEALKADIGAYWSHELMVSSLKMFENGKMLKARIYAVK